MISSSGSERMTKLLQNYYKNNKKYIIFFKNRKDVTSRIFCRQISCLCGTSTTQLANSVVFLRASTIQLANHIRLLDDSTFLSENSTIFLGCQFVGEFFDLGVPIIFFVSDFFDNLCGYNNYSARKFHCLLIQLANHICCILEGFNHSVC